MPNNVKQEELDLAIKYVLTDLTDLSEYEFVTQEHADAVYALVAEYEQDVVLSIKELINQQVIQALERAWDEIKDGGYDSSYELSVVEALIKEYKGDKG